MHHYDGSEGGRIEGVWDVCTLYCVLCSQYFAVNIEVCLGRRLVQ